ncbi:MAG: WecB/TagA/CpsF family glycosyltransferase [Fimbriimonadaceae bacterium]|nr:WecB/TagA/CpsF family glycosyltransferase [Fimbriimonadaceae bacterium]
MTSTTNSPDRSRVDILGVPVDNVTMDETMARLEAFVASKRAHFVITADAAGVVQAQSDESYRQLYFEADLVTPDSAGILWAAKRFGSPIPGRVSGVDLVERVCSLSADKGYAIFFLGAAPGVAELAAERMQLKYPGCNIVGTRNGFFPPESDDVVAAEIAALRPDFLFVAMGIPRQEKFILATRDVVQAKVAMGVGGTFDVFSGRVRRAPVWMQRLKLEWLWRVLQNPSKLGKVALLPKFVMLVLRAKR